MRIWKKVIQISEIEESPRLQAMFYILVVLYLTHLNSLFFNPLIVSGSSASCPAFFQSCERLRILRPVTEAWDYRLFLSLSFLSLAIAAFAGWRKKWSLVPAFLILPFFIELFANLLLLGDTFVSYENYILLLTLGWMFGRKKFVTLRWLMVLLYFISGLSKLHSSWIAGTFFTMFVNGIPLIPFELQPVATNLVVILELAICWLLLSPQRSVSQVAMWLFVAFHIYSFPIISLPFMLHALAPLVVLFYRSPDEELKELNELKFSSVTFVSVAMTIYLLFGNLAPFFMPGDTKRTYEGTSLAFTAFDVTRQAHSTITEIWKNGQVKTNQDVAGRHYEFLRPYRVWTLAKRRCLAPEIERIEWKLNMSISGSPFYKVVDEKNVCSVEFKPFSHNSWLKTDDEIVGYPGLGAPRDAMPAEGVPHIYERPQIQFPRLTAILAPWVQYLVGLYLALSFISAGLVIFQTRSSKHH